MTSTLGFPKKIRLRTASEIQIVFQQGKYFPLGVLSAKVLKTDRTESRFLVAVKKKIGSAPRRNRIKRLTREAIRLNKHLLGASYDICFFISKKPEQLPEYVMIEKEIQNFFQALTRKPEKAKFNLKTKSE